MLGIKLICVGKLKENFFIDAANEYIKRLSGYCKLETAELPEYRINIKSAVRSAVSLKSETRSLEPDSAAAAHNNAHTAIALDKEREAIMSKIPGGAKSIALCIEGQEADSVWLSEMLSGSAVDGVSKLCFIIGGSNGLHESVKKAADLKLSLSRMTLPHNLARIVLLEQLYRAFSILHGAKYHK